MMTTEPRDLIQLACHECGWRPRGDRTMGVVRAHFEAEHQTDKVDLDMLVICPSCDNVCPLTHDDGKRFIHDCPSCKRTYRIPHRKMQSPNDDH